MPRDVYILEYKYKKTQTPKHYEGLNQNNQTNLLLCVMWCSKKYRLVDFVFYLKTLTFHFS